MEAPALAQSTRTHHVRQAVARGQAKFLNLLPGAQSLRLDIVLPLRDPAGLDNFLQDLYNPASPSYRHFLTVSEFTARFGPSQEDYDAVIRYATSNGLQVVGGSRDGMDVQVEGSVAVIEKALHVSMGVYQHPTENRTFYAPDREPTFEPAVRAVACLGFGQLLDPASHARQQERLREGPRHRSRNRRVPCHHRLRPFGFFFGQRHARGLLRRNRPHRRRPEPRIARVSRHRSGRPDHLFQQHRSNQQCAYHPALDRRHQHQLRAFKRPAASATTPSRRST